MIEVILMLLLFVICAMLAIAGLFLQPFQDIMDQKEGERRDDQ